MSKLGKQDIRVATASYVDGTRHMTCAFLPYKIGFPVAKLPDEQSMGLDQNTQAPTSYEHKRIDEAPIHMCHYVGKNHGRTAAHTKPAVH